MKTLIFLIGLLALSALGQPMTMFDPAFRAGIEAVPAASAPAWSPTNVVGLSYWLKASDLGLSDGDPVASWAWGSNVWYQSVSGSRPKYVTARKAVYFDGNDDYLTNATPPVNVSASTFFITFLITNVNWIDVKGKIFNLGAVGVDGFEANLNDTPAFSFYMPGITTIAYTNALSTNAFTTVTIAQGAAGLTNYFNGARTMQNLDGYTFSAPGNRSAMGGDTKYLKGFIAEILCYTNNLHPTNISAINNYLTNTYGGY